MENMALSPELQGRVETLIADHASELANLASPAHIASGIEQADIELGEARLRAIAEEVRKGPSRSVPRARFKNGSHTELQTTTAGSALASSTVQEVDAEDSVRKLLRTHGESSKSFMIPTGKDKESLLIGADRLRSMYRRLGVPQNDAEGFVQVFLGNACRYDHRDAPIINSKNGSIGPAPTHLRELVSNVFSYIRRRFPIQSKT